MVSKFYVYETLLNGDTEPVHHDELTEWDVDPDLVGIEFDPQRSRTAGIDTRSPATSVALAIHEVFRNWITKPSSLTPFSSPRLDAEFAAARRFAQETGAPVVALDRRGHDAYIQTLSGFHRIRDTILVLVAAFAVLGVQWVGPVGPSLPSSAGLLGTVADAVVDAIIAAGVAALVVVGAHTVVLRSYAKWVIETRPAEIVETAVESCAERDADTVLLVVSQRHTEDLRARAEADGIEVDVRSSPATRELDGGSPAVYRLKRMLRLS